MAGMLFKMKSIGFSILRATTFLTQTAIQCRMLSICSLPGTMIIICYYNRPKIVILYALEMGYYLFSTVAVFFEPKMKDRTQMFIHHIFTCFLIVSSYLGKITKFGVPIMLLHDVADPAMEFAKLCVYSGYKTVGL